MVNTDMNASSPESKYGGAITAREVRRVFQDVHGNGIVALESVDLHIYSGEFVSLAWPSGWHLQGPW
ncbi:MAG: hypothetical protein QHH06_13300 [Clostridiales bacterium]|jgi:hypothetical protein|nr:hypothetical protein [Eubacteriales bacterium]MDH7567418.1 hypothetical protein [Clostridiales bacterium]